MLKVTKAHVGDSEFAWQILFETLDSRGMESYLLISKSKEITSQDVRLGQDTHHVEWGDQLHSAYGLLSGFEVVKNVLRLFFIDKALHILKVDEVEELDISNLGECRSSLVKEAQHIFSNDFEIKVH